MSEAGRRGRRWRLFQTRFYLQRVLLQQVHMSMNQTNFEPYRRQVVAGAHGRILNLTVVRLSACSTDGMLLWMDTVRGG